MWYPLLSLWSMLILTCSTRTNASSTTVSTPHHTTWKADTQLPRNSSKPLSALFQPYSPDTPVFKNQSLIKALSSPHKASSLRKRSMNDLPVGACAPGIPCVNGACCSNTGVCSFAPSSCASANCISNCNATAPCGEYALPSEATCPLNVCCSQYGFCE
jgi:chitinase